MNDPTQPLEDGKQLIEGKAEEKRDSKKPEGPFIEGLGPLEKCEITQEDEKAIERMKIATACPVSLDHRPNLLGNICEAIRIILSFLPFNIQEQIGRKFRMAFNDLGNMAQCIQINPAPLTLREVFFERDNFFPS